MKNIPKGLLLITALLLLSSAILARSYAEAPVDSRDLDNTTYIDGNNILMFVTNHGSFGRDLDDVFGYDAGTFYPYVDIGSIEDGSLSNYVLYAAGIWLGGKIAGDTRLAIAEYNDEYVPGPMSGGTYMPDSPEFHTYKLYSDSLADNPNDDYNNWPVAQGAPVDSLGNPAMIGNQLTWSVFNDANPSEHLNNAGETAPLGVEIRHTTFTFETDNALNSVIFHRWVLVNKGDQDISDFYFSLWTDPDLGEYTDDLVGCDTLLQLGFCYNADNNDANHYGSTPPCIGFQMLQSPMIYTGNMDDTVRMWGRTWPGYINIGITSFNKYINGTDPNSAEESYNYMQGLLADGSPYIYNGQELRYVASGDPVAGTGDLDFDPADRRMMLGAGPISFSPGDSTEVYTAMIVARGSDRLTSINLVKAATTEVQQVYENDFESSEPPIDDPFLVEFDYDENSMELAWSEAPVGPSGYDFQGFRLKMQTDSGYSEFAEFDIADGLTVFVDEVWDPTTGTTVIDTVFLGSDNGLTYALSLPDKPFSHEPWMPGEIHRFQLERLYWNPNGSTGTKLYASVFNYSITIVSGLRREVPAQYPTIQAAVDEAVYTDTVVVAPGIYYEHDITVDKAVPVIGETGDPADVVVDAEGLGRGFILGDVSTLMTRLLGLTIIHGQTTRDGLGPVGGGIYAGMANIRNCTFTENVADSGAALRIVWGQVDSCRFFDNTASGGGAVYNVSQAVQITNSVFAGNQADAGGAVHGYSVDIHNCTFVNNTAELGAVIYAAHPLSFYMDKSIVVANTAEVMIQTTSTDPGQRLSCNDFYGNSGVMWPGATEDDITTSGNLSADPQFCDPENRNFSLRGYSFCLPDGNACDTLIGALDEGCAGVKVLMEPGVLPIFYANAVEPMTLHVYLGDISDGAPVSEINAGSFILNGTFLPEATEYVSGIPDFEGEVLDLQFNMASFIHAFGYFTGVIDTTYSLTGNWLTGDEITYSGPVVLLGRVPGDVTADGVVDISDLVGLAAFTFQQGRRPKDLMAADLNCSGEIDISDVVMLVEFMFNGGTAPEPCPNDQ